MRSVRLMPFESTDQGTLGVLVAPGGFGCYSIELPWRDNRSNVSCIPAGEYECTWRRSPTFGWTYWVRDVIDRAWILTHAANWAGDVLKGYRADVAGCIGLGLRHGRLSNHKAKLQRAVFSSRTAVRRFEEHMGRKPFRLIVGGEDFRCLR